MPDGEPRQQLRHRGDIGAERPPASCRRCRGSPPAGGPPPRRDWSRAWRRCRAGDGTPRWRGARRRAAPRGAAPPPAREVDFRSGATRSSRPTTSGSKACRSDSMVSTLWLSLSRLAARHADRVPHRQRRLGLRRRRIDGEPDRVIVCGQCCRRSARPRLAAARGSLGFGEIAFEPLPGPPAPWRRSMPPAIGRIGPWPRDTARPPVRRIGLRPTLCEKPTIAVLPSLSAAICASMPARCRSNLSSLHDDLVEPLAPAQHLGGAARLQARTPPRPVVHFAAISAKSCLQPARFASTRSRVGARFGEALLRVFMPGGALGVGEQRVGDAVDRP